ncbi:TetR/AcrR family transcriptional regulator [Vibrio sinaloensis]|uniref:TetR/AcrR family transcriptional regulator n=1 Tax=Photobacterium sp. (strain ATCC 43367) TaxID=379097 RepID=UPI000580A4B6|nr:TetR/AcrR family transcriptional regulator [Vibrio sinaloensis]KHT50553.1 TetR family transcriptional regulator [Vibrio sinaloensis]
MDKRSQRSERTKLSIILAAIECYKELGVQGASLEVIAKQAGTTKPTVYSHFGSKENLYLAVVEHIMEEEKLNHALPPFDPNQSLRQQLIDIFSTQLERVMKCERRRLLVAITIEAMCQGQCHLNNVESIKTCPMEAWLDSAIHHGALPPQNSAELATNLWALIKGRTFFPVFLGMAPNDLSERQRNLESAIDFFLSCQKTK